MSNLTKSKELYLKLFAAFLLKVPHNLYHAYEVGLRELGRYNELDVVGILEGIEIDYEKSTLRNPVEFVMYSFRNENSTLYYKYSADLHSLEENWAATYTTFHDFVEKRNVVVSRGGGLMEQMRNADINEYYYKNPSGTTSTSSNYTMHVGESTHKIMSDYLKEYTQTGNLKQDS